jgi:hypothetical protein
MSAMFAARARRPFGANGATAAAAAASVLAGRLAADCLRASASM